MDRVARPVTPGRCVVGSPAQVITVDIHVTAGEQPRLHAHVAAQVDDRPIGGDERRGRRVQVGEAQERRIDLNVLETSVPAVDLRHVEPAAERRVFVRVHGYSFPAHQTHQPGTALSQSSLSRTPHPVQ